MPPFGGGYADFAPAQPRSRNVVISGMGNSGALEFGGGVETKPLVRLRDVPLARKFPVGAS
jgi:hypothetical protein